MGSRSALNLFYSIIFTVGLTAFSVSAEPCVASATIEGEPKLAAQLSSMLAARGIVSNAAEGCPSLWAKAEATTHGITLMLKNSSGKVETFHVMEVATAAALIEAWSRVALDPLLPPIPEDDSTEAPLDTFEKEAIPNPILGQLPTTSSSTPTTEAQPTSIHPLALQSPLYRAYFFTQQTLHFRVIPKAPQGGLQVVRELIIDELLLEDRREKNGVVPNRHYYTEGSGLSFSSQLPHQRLPKVQLKVEGRVYHMMNLQDGYLFFGATTVAEAGSEFFSSTEVLPVKTDFKGVDAMLRVGRPYSWRRLSLTPSAAAGGGMIIAQDLVSNVDLQKNTQAQGLLEWQMRASYRLPLLHLALDTFVGSGYSLHSSDEPFESAGALSFLSLESIPNHYTRYGFGLTYQFKW
jgi:hypothetical protein